MKSITSWDIWSPFSDNRQCQIKSEEDQEAKVTGKGRDRKRGRVKERKNRRGEGGRREELTGMTWAFEISVPKSNENKSIS